MEADPGDGRWWEAAFLGLERATTGLVWDEGVGDFKGVWTPAVAEVAAVQIVTTEAHDFDYNGRSEAEARRAAAKASHGGMEIAAAWSAQQRGQCDFLRDIFGNPCRPVTFNCGLPPCSVSSLAQTIYDEQAFNRMPELADALEVAGSTDAYILAHLRGSGPHVRGCWVVDLILGKS